MGGIKRALITVLTGVAGLLLTLAGLNLIELSPKLILYTGILLLVVSILSYIFLRNSKNSKSGGE